MLIENRNMIILDDKLFIDGFVLYLNRHLTVIQVHGVSCLQQAKKDDSDKGEFWAHGYGSVLLWGKDPHN